MAEDAEHDTFRVRGWFARVGVSLLNLLTPGLGLLRVQRLRAALIMVLAPFLWLVILAATFIALPSIPPIGFAVVAVVSLSVMAILWIGSITMTWRSSRIRPAKMPWWSRWYSIVGVCLVVALTASPAVDFLHGFYKPYYLPSAAMLPTLSVGDRLVADMRPARNIRRGDVIILRVGKDDYVKRVAALPGDRVALANGIVILNGTPVPQHKIGNTGTESPSSGRSDAEMLTERFPGEMQPHRIYDSGYSPADDFPEVKIPAGGLFVLGDNRDSSADSRYSTAERGVGIAKLSDIRGRPMFKSWDAHWTLSGAPIR